MPFVNIFFLILTLLLISNAADVKSTPLFPHDAGMALGAVILVYGLVLALIYLQSRWFKYSKERALFVTNLELSLFFLCFFYLFVGQRYFLHFIPFKDTVLSLFSLVLYFFGLALCYYTYERDSEEKAIAWNKAALAIRFIFPFALPYLIFVFATESSIFLPIAQFEQLLGISKGSFAEDAAILILTVAALIGVMILLPPLLVFFWKCPPLTHIELVPRLEELCRRAHFKHAGFRIWTIMENSFTAAILGIIKRFRYILFTQKLINRLSPQAVEAILAHEIGHHYRRHLLIYPVILFGMLVMGSITSIIAFKVFTHYASSLYAIFDRSTIKTIRQIVVLLSFIAIMAIYFRYVFGYFSRLFERQADLHVFELQIPGEAMIEALDQVGIASGFIHLVPSWHHYSIQERIDFLKRVETYPGLIKQHHQKVRYTLIAYLILLGFAVIILNYL